MNPLNFLRQSYITGCRVYSSLQTMYFITVPQSLVLGSKCYSISEDTLWISEMMAWSPNGGTAVCLLYFILSFWIWFECYRRQHGQDQTVLFAASVSIKKATGYVMGLWMRKYELAKCWHYWSYVPIILRNWLRFFSETLPRKYIEGIRDSVLTKYFYL